MSNTENTNPEIRRHVDDADVEGHIKRPSADAEYRPVAYVGDAEVEGHIKRPDADAEYRPVAYVGDAEVEGHIRRPGTDGEYRPVAYVGDAETDDVEGHVRLRNQGPIDDANELRAP